MGTYRAAKKAYIIFFFWCNTVSIFFCIFLHDQCKSLLYIIVEEQGTMLTFVTRDESDICSWSRTRGAGESQKI
jgi:hypothetical protein